MTVRALINNEYVDVEINEETNEITEE